MPFIVVSPAQQFAISGMDKNATEKMKVDFAVVPGWIADPDYPGSAVVNNTGLRVQSAKTSATITARLPFSDGSGTIRSQARLLLNGNQVGIGTEVPGTSGVLDVSATVTVAEGDVVTVEARAVAQLANWTPTITPGADTYVRVT